MVTLEQLQELAALAPKEEPAPRSRRGPARDQNLGPLDVPSYLRNYGYDFTPVEKSGGRVFYNLNPCLFDPNHKGKEAAIVQHGDGMLTYFCYHDSCAHRIWKEAREIISGDDRIAQFCEGYNELRSPRQTSESEDHLRFFIKTKTGKFVFKESLLVDELVKDRNLLHVPGIGLFHWNAMVWEPIHEAYLKAKIKTMLEIEASRSRVNSVAELVLNDKKVLIPKDRELNNIGDCLNLLNGVMDLRTWKLRKSVREDYCTIQIQAHFDPEAKCDRWLQFWEEVRDGRSIELVKTAQEFTGYCMTRDISHQVSLAGVGPGQDGKSTWLNIMEYLLGEANVSNVALPDLNDQFIRMQLHGKLLNWAGETEAEKAILSGWFKQIVGGDTIQAAYKGKDPVSFKPFCKLIFLMNDFPRVKDVSFGFYRKLIILPFQKQFLGAERDKQIESKLKEERDGILNWALVGLQRLRTQGRFTISRESREAMMRFRYENNPVQAFVSECCVTGDGDEFRVLKKDLYNTYKEYCENGGYRKLGENQFHKVLRHVLPGSGTLRPWKMGKRPNYTTGLRLLRVGEEPAGTDQEQAGLGF